jgi:hypothetical protein
MTRFHMRYKLKTRGGGAYNEGAAVGEGPGASKVLHQVQCAAVEGLFLDWTREGGGGHFDVEGAARLENNEFPQLRRNGAVGELF